MRGLLHITISTTAFLSVFGLFGDADAQSDLERAAEAAAYCAAQNKTATIEEFAVCTGSYIAEDELMRCATERRCFGVNLEHIVIYGACGGPNSFARQIFGAGVCGDACVGGRSAVRYYNGTQNDIRPKIKGKCDSREDRETLPPNYYVEWYDTGEQWFWAWTGGVSSPRHVCPQGGEALQYTQVEGGKYNESPREGKWRLLTGHVYEFRTVGGGCVVPFDVTARYRG